MTSESSNLRYFQINLKESVIECFLADEHKQFHILSADNIVLSVGTSLDTIPCVITQSPTNKNSFLIPAISQELSFPEKMNPRILAFTVTVCVIGQRPSSSTNEIDCQVQPKFCFHMPFHWVLSNTTRNCTFRAASWSNDCTTMAMIINWRLSANEQSYDSQLLKNVKTFHVDAESLHNTLRQANLNRRDQIADCVVQMSSKCKNKDSLKKEVKEHFFCVPCSVAGPIGQVIFDDEESFRRQFAYNTDSTHAMGPDELSVDFEQANMFNALSTIHRKSFWTTKLIFVLFKAAVECWQQFNPQQVLPPDSYTNATILHSFLSAYLSKPTHRVQMLDAVASICSQMVGASMQYIPDTNLKSVYVNKNDSEQKVSKIVTDATGESQLMTGVAYRASTMIRQKSRNDKKLPQHLPTFWTDEMLKGERDGANFYGDCEDGSFNATALMQFITMTPVTEMCNLIHMSLGEQFAMYETMLFGIIKTIGGGQCDRTYCATLGLASGAKMGSTKEYADTACTVARTREEAYKRFLTNMHECSGHSWMVGFTPSIMMSLGPVQVYDLRKMMHAEQTSLTIVTTHCEDAKVRVKFMAEKKSIQKQLEPFQKEMFNSQACAVRNTLFAQCLSRDVIDGDFSGVSFENTRDPRGFLQHMICGGGFYTFSTDSCVRTQIEQLGQPHTDLSKQENYLSPTTDIPSRVPWCALRVPCNKEEIKSIAILTACDAGNYPKKTGVFILPPYCLQTFGTRSSVTLLHHFNNPQFDPDHPEALINLCKQTMETMKKKSHKCVGFTIMSPICALFYFNQT